MNPGPEVDPRVIYHLTTQHPILVLDLYICIGLQYTRIVQWNQAKHKCKPQ